MTTITFKNDDERQGFQIYMALTILRQEVKSGLLACNPRKASTLRTLARYFPGLKKTRKAAYKQLLEAGMYKDIDAKKN